MSDEHDCFDHAEWREPRDSPPGTVEFTGSCTECGRGVGARYTLDETWTDDDF